MKINRLYDYSKYERIEDEEGNRLYDTPNGPLPSVTTLLSATADKTSLLEWKARVGEKKAEQIRDEATGLGTLMHEHLECVIQGIDRPRGSNLVRKLASNMADQIIERGFPRLDEVWGFEEALYYPGLYAGTTDLIGVFDGNPAILDYKTTNKMKTKDKIEDYFCQGAAYALAHNEMFNTNIRQVVIFMVSRDLKYECFTVEGEEFDKYAEMLVARVDQYYQMVANGVEIIKD
jgi:genome maintenance exonuclease 1